MFCTTVGEPAFSKHVQQFHRALNEYYRKGGKHLYDQAEMETTSDKHAPGLFAQFYKSILDDDKEKRMEMQKTRVVSICNVERAKRHEMVCAVE